jgi:hypothetical protein
MLQRSRPPPLRVNSDDSLAVGASVPVSAALHPARSKGEHTIMDKAVDIMRLNTGLSPGERGYIGAP